jgi:sec-independent protein translocase protein TatA
MGSGLFQPWHLILILAIALIVLGPGKVGDLGSSLGRSVREFRQAVREEEESSQRQGNSASSDDPEDLPPRAS